MTVTNKYVFNTLESILSDLKAGYVTVSSARSGLSILKADALEIGLELTIPSDSELITMFNVDEEDYSSSQGGDSSY